MKSKITKKASPAKVAKPASAKQDATDAVLPIVGIGASAGGLEAFEKFFRACPADSGMAFVLVPHLDPGHESLLTEILQRTTSMPVVQAMDQVAVAPNHVYIIPPNREMAILNGVLQLSVPVAARGQRMPIDAFLRTLAEDQAEHAIGIILSGTATDGTLGLRAILGAGGTCMVQEPSTAKYDGMPKSAISAGYATHILPVEKMPAMLLEITRHSDFRRNTAPIAPVQDVNGLNQILLQVRGSTGHDFSLYKKSTIGRRIARRMERHNIEDMAVYARYLKEHPAEVQALFKELLINVTSFFRDPEAFDVLKQGILPKLLADKPADYVIRVWVAGCSTGEEAYSIAMLLREYMDESHREFPVQIYATDLDDEAIATARSGSYPPNIAQDVTPERLRRFFIKDDAGSYKIKKDIREMVVFATQNVIKDPPFTRLDLLSCRNLMIYLEPEQQNRLIPKFHYALKTGGVLFLSSSESITSDTVLFTALDRKWKFYQANRTAASTHTHLSESLPIQEERSQMPARITTSKAKAGNIADLSNRILLQSYAPPSVTTDINGNILYVHGDTGKYLRPAPGPVSNNVVEMAREGLQLELRAALLNAATHTGTALSREVSIKTNGGISNVSFRVRRLPSPATDAGTGDEVLLVSFEDIAAPEKTSVKARRRTGPTVSSDAGRVEQLERELAYAKENLQATIEEQQATNEELKSTNEELQSTNEELQSTNEELETSKEEMQSLNEETITVNAELTGKIEQMNVIQNDLKNLLDNMNNGTIFLDYNLIIRRYTLAAQKIYRLVATDVGRPLGDIRSNLESGDLQAEIQEVLDTLVPFEREVRTTDGAWYLARIQPYRTLDNVIEGVVLSFTEVTAFKLASEAVNRSEAMLATALELAQLGSWELDVANDSVHWSSEMFKLFGYPPLDTPISLQEMLKFVIQEDQERVSAAIENSVATQVPYDIMYRVTRQDGTTCEVRSRGKAITDNTGRVTSLIGTTLDITESRQAERVRQGVAQLARQLSEGILDSVSDPLIVLDDGLQVVSASRSFYQHFQVTAEQTVGKKIYDLGNGQWDIPALRDLLENILPHDHALDGYVVEHDFPSLGRLRMVLNARRIVTAIGNTELILLAMVTIKDGVNP